MNEACHQILRLYRPYITRQFILMATGIEIQPVSIALTDRLQLRIQLLKFLIHAIPDFSKMNIVVIWCR